MDQPRKLERAKVQANKSLPSGTASNSTLATTKAPQAPEITFQLFEFQPFPRLPIELRVAIYKLACTESETRVVEIFYNEILRGWVSPSQSYFIANGSLAAN